MKMLMILLSAMFLLSACTSGVSDDSGRVATQGAGTPEEFEAEHIKCWQKALVENLYDIMSKATSEMYSKITKGAFAFMMTAFAIWLAFRLLSHVSSFTEENPAEVWTEIFRKALLCFVCGLIASNPGFLMGILNLTVFPVYGAFLEFGSEILAKTSDHVNGYSFDPTVGDVAKAYGAVGAASGNPFGMATGGLANAMANASGAAELKLFDKPIEWFNSEPVICSVGKMDNATVDGFPMMPKKMMSCLICALNKRMNLGFALSFEIMGVPGITPTLIGLMILLCFTFVKLGFVFYLVDTIFRFTMMIVIMPIMIMGFAFQYTRGWLGKGIMTILNSAAFMMFIAVVMAMAMAAVETIITEHQDIFSPKDGDIKATFQEFSIPFMCLLMICFLIASSIGVAQQLTDKLVGGSSKSEFNKKVQTVLMGIVNGIIALCTAGSSLAVQKSVTAAKLAAKAAQAKQKIDEKLGRN